MDTALNFIDPGYTGYANNSTEKGNYSGDLIKTGANEAFKVKNIYDIAGNVLEMTMESKYTIYRAYRGGDFSNDGFKNPASRRDGQYTDILSNKVGFRIALYL